MESPASRLLELLSLLQSRPRWNAVELAERQGVTERTIRRDVSRLRDLGYPVLAEPGRTGGYQLGAGGALPPLLLSDDEAVAVALGLRAAASGAVVGAEEAAVAALAKLEQVLPARLRERVLALNSATVLVYSGAAPTVESDVLLTLAQGCRRSERVRFGYTDGAGRQTDRRVEPYGLVNADRRWYLVALDLDRADWRTFRLDRMLSPTLTGHRFVRTSEPDTAAMVLDARARAPYPWVAEVFLRAKLAEATREISSAIGTLERVEGGTLLRIGANDLEWIAGYLAGLRFEFEIRHPPELRTTLRALSQRLAAASRRPVG